MALIFGSWSEDELETYGFDGCQMIGCPSRPLYGFPGDEPTVCGQHKFPGMVQKVLRYLLIF